MYQSVACMYMYHLVHVDATGEARFSSSLVQRCLAAFVEAGTIDISLDQLAKRVGTSKRMFVHYFGGREDIEEGAMSLLEERLRARFAPESFPPGVSAEAVIAALWERTTAPEAKGVLLLVMDLSRRALERLSKGQALLCGAAAVVGTTAYEIPAR